MATSPTSRWPVGGVEGADYVLHQAAIPSVPRSVEDPVTSNRANIDATLNVLVAARDAGGQTGRLRRFVVGVRERRRAAEAGGHADRAAVALRAAEARGRAVHAAVHVALSVSRRSPSGTSTSSARGRIRRRRTRASSRSSSPRSSRTVRPTIYGDGNQTRDFTYVANVVDGVLRACTAPAASGQVINVATGGRISLNDLFRSIAKITGADRAAAVCAQPRGRRPRFTGRYQSCGASARISADRRSRRRARADDRLVSRGPNLTGCDPGGRATSLVTVEPMCPAVVVSRSARSAGNAAQNRPIPPSSDLVQPLTAQPALAMAAAVSARGDDSRSCLFV